MRTSLRLATVLAAVAMLGVALAGLPVLATAPAPVPVDPAAPAAASPSPAPEASRGPKPEKSPVPSEPIELRGTVRAATDEEGVAYTLVDAAGAAWDLEVGPPWWWGAKHPLAAYVGKTVTVTGERRLGAREVDVFAVDGTTIREAGKPPWAGGWKVVGERHPGWSQDKADRWESKQAARLVRCSSAHPPGYCKKLPVPTAP
jgi:hypothetical protein